MGTGFAITAVSVKSELDEWKRVGGELDSVASFSNYLNKKMSLSWMINQHEERANKRIRIDPEISMSNSERGTCDFGSKIEAQCYKLSNCKPNEGKNLRNVG